MIDCGADWRGRIANVAPTAILLTHAHYDHAGGLTDGAPCPVYATEQTWSLIRHFALEDRRRLPLRRALRLGRLRVKAFPVEHSIRAPAVGYRVSAGSGVFVYLPDVARIPDAAGALRRITLYIGDGATLTRSMVRDRGRAVIGHAPIVAQLDWCAANGVRRAIFTHCGSRIVRGDVKALAVALRQLGRERGVAARFADDGDRLRMVARRRSPAAPR
jgi:phosphoribosyl 1,2-cyclic phosphodiesterase